MASGTVSHQEIIDCLKVELAEREQHGTQQFQQSLLNYIKDSGWKLYESKTLKPSVIPYGTELE